MTAPFTTFTTPTWSIGGLQFNCTDANGVAWLVGFPSGAGAGAAPTSGWFDIPTMRLFDTPLPRHSGEYRSNSFKSGRPIIINGYVEASTKALREAARDQLLGLAFQGGTLQLTVTDDYSTRWAMVELQDLKTSAANPTSFDFQLSLLALDPRKYSTTAVSSATTVPTSTGGLDYSTGGGLDYTGGATGGLVYGTPGASGVFSLSNTGTADSWPVWTLTGPLTNPTIINNNTGQQIAYSGSIASGSTLVITTSPMGRSVLLNGNDVRSNLTYAQWFSVAAGGTVSITLGAGSTDTGLLTGTVYPAWW